MSTRRRIALFTHDAYGLGHVRRSVNILRAVARQDPTATMLLITGSPATQALKALPPHADYVKIPTIVTSGDERTRPPTLDIGVAELASLRGHLVREALAAFDPDVFLVDNFPLGTRLELLPALRALRSRPTRVVLGLRDVVDPPEKVRKDWSRDGLYEIIERHYCRILVYGTKDILDAAASYEFGAELADRVNYCGYVTPDDAPRLAPEVARAEARVGEGFLLATAGGGGDGLPLLGAFLGALDRFPDRDALVVAGEFMSPHDREDLARRAEGLARARVIESVADLPSLMAAAGAVVAMGGYNTAAEILAVGARAVLVPRAWRSGEHGVRGKTGVDAEQLVRVQALARLGLVEAVEPGDLSGDALADAIGRALSREARRGQLPLDGAERVATHLLALCGA